MIDIKTNAMKTLLLPQYHLSKLYLDKFHNVDYLDDTHLVRSLEYEGVNDAEDDELSKEKSKYFYDNKEKLETNYYEELSAKIGETKARFFSNTIATYWYDQVEHADINVIRIAIKKYLIKIKRDGNLSDHMCETHIANDSSPYRVHIDELDIAKILTLNDQFMTQELYSWYKTHEFFPSSGTDDILYRKGLSLKDLIDVDDNFKEKEYINSYSLAFTTAIKFSGNTDIDKPLRCIVNADFSFFNGRVLFFYL